MTAQCFRGYDLLGAMPRLADVSERRRDGQPWYGTRFFLAAIVLLSLLQGCASPVRLAAVPKDEQAAAVVDGMPGIRY